MEAHRCSDCDYRRPLGGGDRAYVFVCHYCIDEDKLRSVPVDECYKNKIHFKPKLKKRPRPKAVMLIK